MAVQEKRGWIWTDNEKKWITTWKGKLRIHYRQISEQVSRYRRSLPQFTNETVDIAEPFLETAKLLLSLDGRTSTHGRKYQSISPEDAKSKFDDVLTMLSAWAEFTKRPDVQYAIKEVNTEMRAKKSEKKKQLEWAQAKALGRLKSKDFSKQLDAKVSKLIESAFCMAAVAQGIDSTEHKNPFDRTILQRLLLVHFVRFTYEYDSERKEQIKQFIIENSYPMMRDVLKQAIYLLIQDSILNPSPLFSPQRKIEGLFNNACESLMLGMKEWKKKGVNIKNINRKYFTLLNIDYSLEARPE